MKINFSMKLVYNIIMFINQNNLYLEPVKTCKVETSNDNYIYIACGIQILAIVVISMFSLFVLKKSNKLFIIIGFILYVHKVIALLMSIKDVYTRVNEDVISIIWNTIIYLVPFVLFLLCAIFTEIFDEVELPRLIFIIFVLFWKSK